MKKLLLVTSIVLSTSLLAAPNIPASQKVGSFVVEEITPVQNLPFNGIPGGIQGGFTGPGPISGPGPLPLPPVQGDRIAQTGQVIQVARDMVALGEAIYTLVQKGKPSNITEYAPISIVPRDPITKEYIDPFELEGFSMPVERNYVARIKNGNGKEVVTFNYKVLFSYGGSYNGMGKYLSNVIIVPGSVKTSYGWEFNATMKLSGIMNHGTKADPIAGIMVTIKYQMNSWSVATERNDTIHITGKGEIKNFNQ